MTTGNYLQTSVVLALGKPAIPFQECSFESEPISAVETTNALAGITRDIADPRVLDQIFS